MHLSIFFLFNTFFPFFHKHLYQLSFLCLPSTLSFLLPLFPSFFHSILRSWMLERSKIFYCDYIWARYKLPIYKPQKPRTPSSLYQTRKVTNLYSATFSQERLPLFVLLWWFIFQIRREIKEERRRSIKDLLSFFLPPRYDGTNLDFTSENI